MTLLQELTEAGKQLAIYFDYTGAGRGPEIIAGPFSSMKEVKKYAKENDIDLKHFNYFAGPYKKRYERIR